MNITQCPTGMVHLVSAILAMVFGTIVVFNRKGTKFHKRIGYCYAISMLVLNVTAFMIYHLFGKFGSFHIAALVSLGSLCGGLIPAFLRSKNWLEMHYEFMGWSVIGLYAAFWAETSVRFFPFKYFWVVVIIAGSLTCGLGYYYMKKNKSKWIKNKKA